MTLRLPDSGAPAHPDGRRVAPSAERNLPHLLAVLAGHAPERGTALEIASGTGQQIAAFARTHHGLDWQPTDANPDNLGSINAWCDYAGLPNLRAPLVLDAGRAGWTTGFAPRDFVMVVNLLHLISDDAAGEVLTGMAEVLGPGGRMMIYGPFLRDGQATSEGDTAFDASLRAQNPAIGYKDIGWVTSRLEAAGVKVAVQSMPANNLAVLGQHS